YTEINRQDESADGFAKRCKMGVGTLCHPADYFWVFYRFPAVGGQEFSQAVEGIFDGRITRPPKYLQFLRYFTHSYFLTQNMFFFCQKYDRNWYVISVDSMSTISSA